MAKRIYILALAGLLMTVELYGQGQKAIDFSGKVEWQDSLLDLGRPSPVTVTLTHPSNSVVIFPDTAKDFAPFEVVSSRLIPTHSHEGVSIDTKVFYVNSWEVDPRIGIRLPFYYIQDGDTLMRLTNSDSIEFAARIVTPTDSLSLKIAGFPLEVKDPPNVLLWGILGTLGTIFLLILGAILYKPLVKRFRRWQIGQEWKKIARQLEGTRPLANQPDAFILSLSKVWRNYLNRNWPQHLPSLTSTEFSLLLENSPVFSPEDKAVLEKASYLRDKILFAGIPLDESQLGRLTDEVKSVLEREYDRRKEAWK